MTIISRARILDVFQTFRALHQQLDDEAIAQKVAIALGIEPSTVLEVVSAEAVDSEGGSTD